MSAQISEEIDRDIVMDILIESCKLTGDWSPYWSNCKVAKPTDIVKNSSKYLHKYDFVYDWLASGVLRVFKNRTGQNGDFSKLEALEMAWYLGVYLTHKTL